MSLKVTHLTKTYGEQHAVNDISFEISKGEIVGFLGPNGAGKSTTMKIATGYIPPTAGVVHVNGIDVVADPIGVKRITGYLPEHNPLYHEMYVHEYLCFVAALYGYKGKRRNQRVGEMIERCGLVPEQNKKIEMLSKGYRQRVGLAQALLHDPEVLILDEPTTGLDPNQLVEIRNLIREVSANKTVIFSTHIMQEVQHLCNRVIVISRGNIVADESLAGLLGRRAADAVIVEFETEVDPEALLQIPGVRAVERVGTNRYRISANDADTIRQEVFRFAADQNLSLVGLRKDENNLESVFRELTQ